MDLLNIHTSRHQREPAAAHSHTSTQGNEAGGREAEIRGRQNPPQSTRILKELPLTACQALHFSLAMDHKNISLQRVEGWDLSQRLNVV